MRVLHLYSQDSPRLAMYVSLLSQAMSAGVECSYADTMAAASTAMDTFRPDIVHQHGRWTAIPTPPAGCPARLVVSPHGEAADVQQAYAVVARSPYEMTVCKTSRKELVQNPLITKTITFDRAAAAIADVYRRVMDSDPLRLIDDTTRRLLAIVLKAGLLGDRRWVDAEWEALQAQGGTADADFRHLFIYADLEGVADVVEKGMDIIGIEAPTPPATDCYLPQGYTPSAPLKQGKATAGELLADIARQGATLRRLTELMRTLHDDRLDEAALMAQAEAAKQRPLMQALMQLLSEQCLLTEGFMPCPPADNDLTDSLRQQITNHLRII